MTQEHLISVIIPVYNVEKYLHRCVDSILSQTYRNLEVILVDDGAKDSSGRICDEYAALDSRVRVLHKENGGQARARNMALDIAKGEYIAFVDSDDWLVADAYEVMLEQMLINGVKLVCGGRINVMDGTNETFPGLCPTKREVISAQEAMARLFLWDNIDSALWDKLYHRSVWDKIRFPQKSNFEDVAVVYLLLEQAEKILMLDKPVYYYLQRVNSTSTAPVSDTTFHFEQYTAEIYNYIRENYPGIQDQARYYRVRSLVNSVICVDLAKEESRKKYADRCRSSRKELRKHMNFILKSPFFGRQERITDILLAMGIYRPLRKLYHRLK